MEIHCSSQEVGGAAGTPWCWKPAQERSQRPWPWAELLLDPLPIGKQGISLPSPFGDIRREPGASLWDFCWQGPSTKDQTCGSALLIIHFTFLRLNFPVCKKETNDTYVMWSSSRKVWEMYLKALCIENYSTNASYCQHRDNTVTKYTVFKLLESNLR